MARLKQAILWLGLLLCGYALWRARVLAGGAIGRVGLANWVLVGVLLATGWACAVVAWRRYLLAYTGQEPGWRVAMRQLGLLLVGKYVPGGVFGFLARVYDPPSAPSRKPLFWAGLAEQAVGVGMSVALGGVLFAAAGAQAPAWLLLALPLPLAAVVGVWLLHRSAAWLPWVRTHAGADALPRWPVLLQAAAVHLLQLVAWVALIAVLANALFGVGGHAMLGTAGAFLLAVGAGMLVVVVPGGIGVREAVLVGLASCWLEMPQAIFLAALLRVVASVLDAAAGMAAAMVGRRGTG